MLIEYVRKHGRKVGVIVAVSKEEIGWAKCRNLDRFDKFAGREIAHIRAIKHDLMTNAERCAESMKPAFIKMVRRANRYFKEDNMTPQGWECIEGGFEQIPETGWTSQNGKICGN